LLGTGIGLLLLTTYGLRVFPFMGAHTAVPLGYDPGLYKAIFEAYANQLPNIHPGQLDFWMTQHEMGLFLFTNLLHVLSYTSSFLLTFFFAFLATLVGIYLWLLIGERYPEKKWLTAFLTLGFFLLSICQYQVFWWGYYKNMLGLIFMLVSLFLLHRKSWLSLLPLGFLLLVHRPTALYTAGLITVYLLWHLFLAIQKGMKEKKVSKAVLDFIKDHLEIRVGLLALLLFLPFYFSNFNSSILTLAARIGRSFTMNAAAGTFFSIPEYLFLSHWYWPLALYGLYESLRKKHFGYLEAGFVFGMLWVFLKLYFYSRMIIQLDIFLIAMAVIGIIELTPWIRRFRQIAAICLTVLFILIGWQTVQYVKTNGRPLIKWQEFEFIQSLPDKMEENAIIISTHKHYSAWLMGYSGRDVIAPGLFDLDRWGKAQWEDFWKGTATLRAEMLKDYADLKRPLYIFVGITQPHYFFDDSNCFKYINRGSFDFIKYICNE